MKRRLLLVCLAGLLAAPVGAAELPSPLPADEEASPLAQRSSWQKRKAAKKQRALEEEEARKAEEEELQREAEEKVAAEAEAEEQAAAAAAKAAAAQQEAEAAKKAAALEEQAVAARGLDARVRRLSDALARAIKRLPGDHRDHSFAVMPFGDNDDESRARQLGLVVSDMVLTNLSRDHRINLSERSGLQQILQEQSLQISGAVDPDEAVEVGRLAGARGLIVGEVTDTGEAFRVGARVLDMETAEVIAAEEAELPKEELIAFSADAVVLRSRSGSFFRSAVAPGWGQVYNREPVKAAVVGGSVGLLAASSVVLAGTALFTHNAYQTFSPDKLPTGVAPTQDNVARSVVSLRESANAQYTAALVLGGLTATAWLLGALDAYLSGVDVDSLDEALARN